MEISKNPRPKPITKTIAVLCVLSSLLFVASLICIIVWNEDQDKEKSILTVGAVGLGIAGLIFIVSVFLWFKFREEIVHA